MNSLNANIADHLDDFDLDDPIRIPPEPEDPVARADPYSNRSGLGTDYFSVSDEDEEQETSEQGCAQEPEEADSEPVSETGFTRATRGGNELDALYEKYLAQGLTASEVAEKINTVDKLLTCTGKTVSQGLVYAYKNKHGLSKHQAGRVRKTEDRVQEQETTAPETPILAVEPDVEPKVEAFEDIHLQEDLSGLEMFNFSQEVFTPPSKLMGCSYRQEVQRTKDGLWITLMGFGLSPQNLSITFENDLLVVKGGKATDQTSQTVKHTFHLLPEYDLTEIHAKFVKADDYLKITVPMKKVPKTGTVQVEIVD